MGKKSERLPTFFAIDSMNQEELQILMNRIKITIVDLKGQIGVAQATRQQTGDYADPMWWVKIKKALAVHQRYDQYVQQSLGKVRRANRECSLPEMFMSLCESTLPSCLFQDLKEKAIAKVIQLKEG